MAPEKHSGHNPIHDSWRSGREVDDGNHFLDSDVSHADRDGRISSPVFDDIQLRRSRRWYVYTYNKILLSGSTGYHFSTHHGVG